MEIAIGTNPGWYWLYDHPGNEGFEVKLFHPLKTKPIAYAKVQTDKVDSATLAHLLRSKFLPLSYVPERPVRLNGELLRYRASLVKTEAADNTIRISFKDNGPGIAPENLDRIFDPFFTTREAGQGTGLGLSICHGIISEHKGRIYAESKLGRGATFIVELPIIAEEKQPGLVEPASDESVEVTGAKILVVDDELATLQLLSQILSSEGYEVETVNNATDALERIKGERYSLILLDIKMPGRSGMELYRDI
jgi:CheY-like chemotaxis protein